MSSEHAHGPMRASPWKHDGVRVVPADQLDPNTAQTPGMNRKAAINFARVGAQKLWAGTVHIHPDAKTGAHHHGHLESVIYVVRGRARMRWGNQLEFTAEAGPGDFIYIPPYVPHQEINASADETLECVLCRSDGEAVAVNLDIEPVEKPETVLWIDPDPSTRRRMKLSVLDQSVSLAGGSEDAAIRDTLSLAEDCERLGYSRFWLSEHHGLPTIVGSAPEILMAAIAARTTRIRIGSAGVMLPHYSALKVAEQFRVLEALAPGRIDLGVGRAPGGDMRTARALNPNASHAAEDFPVQVRDLHAWTSLGTPCRHHRPSARAARARDLDPRQLRLRRAARGALRPALCLRLFLHRRAGRRPGDGALSPALPAERAPSASRRRRSASGRWPPKATRRRAHLALSRDRWRIDRQRGALGPLQSPDAIAARGFSEAELAMLAPMRSKAFVGSAASVGAKIRKLAGDFELDEVVINTWAHDPAVRRRSYALIAEEFALAPA